jgi:predicted glycoside hydrolase/deacetylase ChbG (UPF0249 family)
MSPARLGLLAQFDKKLLLWIKEEISLQFRRFSSTGLPFFHVDSHHHIHIHPGILKIIIKNCKTYGIKSIRLPYEPWSISFPICNGHRLRNISYIIAFSFFSKVVMKNARSVGLIFPDGVFGLYQSGEITEQWLLMLLERLKNKEGIFEIYLHPEDRKGAPGYEELKAITSKRVIKKIKEIGANLIRFSELENLIHT